MSVIVGISADCDYMLENAGYRVLMEIASARTDRQEDKRALEEGAWAHFLDLPRLEPAQARRIAWLLDEAAQVRIEDWLEQGTEASLAGAAYYVAFQSLLQEAFGRPPVTASPSDERPLGD